ncbi:Thioredoxin-like [Cnuella takakiae]|uniref:Thioredoxin-like n=1 Tax=Cnuella takakiae TaxID=1302690 RepID=A0A1M5AUU4_9BACT|nr:thioredoxin family protein [Cnuella takakiae]OLY93234.1 thioredoxin family protein [Cnuella takakiae]SHF33990.1 Thioredoxin-like [Cnuella takakiae]
MRFLIILALLFSTPVFAGDSTRLYNPAANAEKDISALLLKAKAEKKHVLIQVGGNWCIWCYRFNAFVQTDTLLKQLVSDNYLYYHLNYSKENKNLAVLARLGYPQRFGFPVMVVLDARGQRLHTQNSSLLEKGNGYDDRKVKAFLQAWSPAAFLPELYKE